MCIRVSPADADFISPLSVQENFYIVATIDSLLLNNLSGAMPKYLSNEATFIPIRFRYIFQSDIFITLISHVDFFPNTDDVTILRRFEPLSGSSRRLRASMKMPNFGKKNTLLGIVT